MLLERDLIQLEPARVRLRDDADLQGFALCNPSLWFVARIESDRLSYGAVRASLPDPGTIDDNTTARN